MIWLNDLLIMLKDNKGLLESRYKDDIQVEIILQENNSLWIYIDTFYKQLRDKRKEQIRNLFGAIEVMLLKDDPEDRVLAIQLT